MKEVVDSTAVAHKYCDNQIEVSKKERVLQYVFFNDTKLLTRYITNSLGHEKFTSSCTFDSISWEIEKASMCCNPDTIDLIVEVEHGKLKGKYDKSALNGKKYCSFLGIPYAQPPLDDLRFRPPQPLSPWNGIYDATYERSSCIQYDPFMFLSYGDEDCLYLNLYTPQLPSKIANPLPVMVFIHGGGFIHGSGSNRMYSPDYLISHDIIFVAFNYRLHVLGFLNLGLEECPGNVGLKDQISVLKWIKNNIAQFGGDPNNVTIFGESAGSACVHYLMLIPQTEGLFSKAILQSGTATAPWAFTTEPLKIAFNFGRKAGYDGEDCRELVKHLKTLSAGDLNRCAQIILDLQREESPTKYANIPPSIETIMEGAVLLEDPSELAKSVRQIPTIWGRNDLDGFIAFMFIPRHGMDKLKKDFTLILRDHFIIEPDLLPVVGEKVRKLYFEEKYYSLSTGKELSQLFTDIYFNMNENKCIEPLLKSNHPPYFYEFSFHGRLNFILLFIKMLNLDVAFFSDIKGACHADELCYLFYPRMALLYPPAGEKAKEVIKHMTTMWTNFARNGNPSTDYVEWKPSTMDELCYLDIKFIPEMKSGNIGGERTTEFYKIMDRVAKVKCDNVH